VYPPRGHGAPPQDGRIGPPIFDYNACTLNAVLTDDMTFMSFDSQIETKVLFLMYFGSQIKIYEYYDDTNNGRLINN